MSDVVSLAKRWIFGHWTGEYSSLDIGKFLANFSLGFCVASVISRSDTISFSITGSCVVFCSSIAGNGRRCKFVVSYDIFGYIPDNCRGCKFVESHEYMTSLGICDD